MSARAFDALKASGKLPGLSPAGAALHNMKRAGECDPDEVVRAIESDAALAELCLRLANARRADGQGEFETVDDLVDELGAPSVRCMGLAFAIVLSNRVGVCERFDYDRFWSLSLARGVSAFAVAREVGEPSATAAFACGLLAGIGRLALASVFPSEVAELLSLHGSVDGRELRAHEEGRFELDAHAATLAWLADYGFPDAFVEAVKLSDPVRLDPLGGKPPEGFAGVVATAEQVAGILLEGRASMLAMIGLQRVRRMIDVDRERIALVGDRAAEEWGRWGDLLRIPTHPVPSFAELLSEEILGESRPDVASTELSSPDPEKPRILAVDDEAVSLRVLSRSLEVAGYEVWQAKNGREALLSALHNDPGIVIADWMMPEMDGIELCKALRRFDAGRRIFFILLTGADQEENVIEAFEAGVDDFVSKPFRPKRLLARMKAAERVIHLQRQIEIDKRLLREHLAEKSALARRLRSAAFTDVLTELPNRRYAIKRLDEEWAAAERSGTPLSVVMIDIDHFKRVNDEHGHDVGDAVLRETAGVLGVSTRQGESACRLGGEEFLIICSNSDLEQATSCGERIRSAVEKRIIRDGTFAGNVTVSVGVAEKTDQVADLDNLIKLADEAVYRAKAGGRNRVIAWGDEDPEIREAG